MTISTGLKVDVHLGTIENVQKKIELGTLRKVGEIKVGDEFIGPNESLWTISEIRGDQVVSRQIDESSGLKVDVHLGTIENVQKKIECNYKKQGLLPKKAREGKQKS